MTLVETIDSLLLEAERCTQATLSAFGIDSCPLHGNGVLSALKAAGYTAQPLEPWHWQEGSGSSWGDWDYGVSAGAKSGAGLGMKLGDFVKRNPKGAFYLMTAGHALALVDGELTDTAAGTGRRRLTGAFRVTGKGL